jgi:hypothetical protein
VRWLPLPMTMRAPLCVERRGGVGIGPANRVTIPSP